MRAAHALERDDLAVLDPEDRLDVQQRSGHRGRLADPAALGQVFEGLDRPDHPAPAPEALDEGIELLVRRPALEPPLDGEREHREPGGDAARVDRPHAAVAELLGGAARALDRARQLRRQVQRENPRVAAELFVRTQKVRRRRLRRRRRGGYPAEPLVELVRAELLVVAETLVAEADV